MRKLWSPALVVVASVVAVIVLGLFVEIGISIAHGPHELYPGKNIGPWDIQLRAQFARVITPIALASGLLAYVVQKARIAKAKRPPAG